MKKIIISILVLAVVAIGALFLINGKSSYDPTKYSLEIEPKDKPFGVGSTIKFTLPDQFDKAHSLSSDTKKLVFAFTKETGHIVRELMLNQKEGYLESKKALIIADISSMPTVITNTFALPDLRKSKYPTLLIYDKNMAKRLKENQDKDKVIVMTLENSKVVKVEYASTIEELKKLL